MKLPVAFIDFEATSLNLNSFPIEVGIAVATSAEQPVLVWSTLIRPASGWHIDADWDSAAERTHKISRNDLREGRNPSEAAQALNQLLAPVGHAWCDGGPYDVHWRATLYSAAKMRPAFRMWDMAGLFVLDRHLRTRIGVLTAESTPTHRAGPDAARLCSALLVAKFGTKEPTVLQLDIQGFKDRIGLAITPNFEAH